MQKHFVISLLGMLDIGEGHIDSRVTGRLALCASMCWLCACAGQTEPVWDATTGDC